MAIMKWNTPPKGDMEDRRAHLIGHGDGVSLQHAVSGSKVEGAALIDSNPNYGLAIKWSTAPYREDIGASETPTNPWGYRDAKRVNRCMGNDDTCMAWAVNKYDKKYCNAHGQSVEKALFEDGE